MKRCLSLLSFSLLAIAVSLSGCQKPSEEKKPQSAEEHKPVTVRMQQRGGFMNDEEFQRYVVDPVNKKYPYITVEPAKGNLTEDIAAGTTPDIVVFATTEMYNLDDLGLTYPLTELIKKYNMDVNRFEPVALETIKIATNKNELVALPYTRHFSALYYNKDIFDVFGVPYPTDGMTWDDAKELAKRVTRFQDGVQFRGLEPNELKRPLSQLSLAYVDPKTNKALVHSDAFKQALTMIHSIYSIPGNDDISIHDKANNQFTKERRLAMLASNNILYDAGLDKLPDLNWDMVSYPTWKEAPGKGLHLGGHTVAIPSNSKHKDEAFLVIETLTSDEVGLDLSRRGRISTLKDQKFKDAFGADMPFMKGKNIQAIYKTTPAPIPEQSPYTKYGESAVANALKKMVKENVDNNTALSQAEEETNKKIEEALAAKQ